MQPVCGEIGADDRDQRHHRRVFGEKIQFLMCDQECGEIAEHDTGDDADDGLLGEVQQR